MSLGRNTSEQFHCSRKGFECNHQSHRLLFYAKKEVEAAFVLFTFLTDTYRDTGTQGQGQGLEQNTREWVPCSGAVISLPVHG